MAQISVGMGGAFSLWAPAGGSGRYDQRTSAWARRRCRPSWIGDHAWGDKEVQRMENVEIARVLEQYADLLDIRAENPFRVRSYRKAAQTVAGLSRPVAQLIEAGEDLTTLP